ncbi:hypothetical protein ALC56_08662 [Trachymyrmex septentrionalis]|uniref:Uncharacterized protein n=1 Tax=Trachymyrmex septentrionalis TaxID=34720 RepID=A0A195F913_9HYME|nr:hypothetical protein ALC56_08662 [Trachymyrmex septentrionalis]
MSVAPNSSNHEKKRYLPPGDTNKSAGLTPIPAFDSRAQKEITLPGVVLALQRIDLGKNVPLGWPSLPRRGETGKQLREDEVQRRLV